MSEKIYQTLVAEQLSDMPESVHLTDYPVVDTKFMEEYASIVPEMNVVRIISEMGQTIRTTNALKVRQPLAKLEVQFSLEDDTAGLTLTPWMSDIIAAELNVLEVIEVPKLAESDTIKTAENTTLGIQIGLETSLTPELAAAGMVREVIRAIQALRKTQGLQMGQTAAVTYSTDSKELAEVIEANLEQIKQAVSAATIQPGEADMVQKVNDHELKLKVEATN
jgi:isoleucyl-tRNA synthetase